MTTATASNLLELRHASTEHAIFVVVPERTFFVIDGVATDEGAVSAGPQTRLDKSLFHRGPSGSTAARRTSGY